MEVLFQGTGTSVNHKDTPTFKKPTAELSLILCDVRGRSMYFHEAGVGGDRMKSGLS